MPNAANDTDSAELASGGVSDIEIIKTVDETLPILGDQVTYTVTANNLGTNDDEDSAFQPQPVSQHDGRRVPGLCRRRIGSPADRQIETPFYLVDTHGNRAGARISDATPKVVELTAGRVRGFA